MIIPQLDISLVFRPSRSHHLDFTNSIISTKTIDTKAFQAKIAY